MTPSPSVSFTHTPVKAQGILQKLYSYVKAVAELFNAWIGFAVEILKHWRDVGHFIFRSQDGERTHT